jgi:hypothetical protein
MTKWRVYKQRDGYLKDWWIAQPGADPDKVFVFTTHPAALAWTHMCIEITAKIERWPIP